MKKLMFTAAVAALMCSCANPNAYTIEGSFEGLENQVYVLSQHGEVIDSAKVENGAFRLEGIVESPAPCFLADAREQRDMTFAQVFFLEPGAMHASKTEDAVKVEGTKANDNYAKFGAEAEALRAEFRPDMTEEEMNAIGEKFDALNARAIEENRDNILGVALFQGAAGSMESEEALAEIEKFTPEMQASPLMQTVKEGIEKAMKTEIGQPFIEIEQPDAEGKVVKLSEVTKREGVKYVLVDFWASWCGPCRGEIPHLVATYNSFKDKGLEIYGVSLDDNKDAWQGLVAKKEMAWINLSDLKGWENPAAQAYGVRGIPANFLIDCATGKFIAKDLRGEALIEKMEELLGK